MRVIVNRAAITKRGVQSRTVVIGDVGAEQTVKLEAVEEAFGADVDYAMLIKLYGEAPEQGKRYSPAHDAQDVERHATRAILILIL